MYNFFSKNGQTLSFVIGIAISAIFVIMIITGMNGRVLSSETFKGDDGVVMDAPQVLEKLETINLFDFGFYATYALLIIAVAAAVLLSLFYFFMNFKVSALKGLVPIIVLFIVFFVVYSSYSPDTSDIYQVKVARDLFGVGDTQSQIVSGSISAVGFGLAAACISLVVAEVVNIFR